DKKGLLEAVVAEIDAEMNVRLSEIARQADNAWQGFVAECIAYIEMALEPEIQRIMLRDGPSVLGDPSTWPSQSECIRSMATSLQGLADDGIIVPIDGEAAARLLSGAMLQAALWIANARDPQATSQKAVPAFQALLDGLLADRATP
ncbi:MAG: TetR/AcrR family transcriptional regulator, partial [Phreatobacter sp.]